MPTIQLCDSAPDFLQYLLDLPEARSCHITLIVCGGREGFLESLIKSFENDGGAQVDGPHPLLANTIDLIARSQNIELVFCPGLAHLRAYLGTFGSKRRHDKERRCDEKLELNSHDMLAVLDPLSFHKEKLDFSAQEISKTLSLMVQLAYNEGLRLVMCQCEGIRDGEELMEGQDVWNMSVPLLSTPGSGQDVARQMVNLKYVARRWFRFEGSYSATRRSREPPRSLGRAN